MPVNRILSVAREKIVVSGDLPDEILQAAFVSAAGDSPVVSVNKSYSEENDQTTIEMLPYHIFSIYPPPEYKRFSDGISRERRLVFPGILIDSEEIVNTLVEDMWVPARKAAKRKKDDDLKWVVVTPRIVKDKATGKTTTEISFFIETKEKGSKAPRGCEPQNITETLDRAAKMILDVLLDIVNADSDRGFLEANRVLNDFSTIFPATLEKELMDAEQAEMFP